MMGWVVFIFFYLALWFLAATFIYVVIYGMRTWVAIPILIISMPFWALFMTWAMKMAYEHLIK